MLHIIGVTNDSFVWSVRAFHILIDSFVEVPFNPLTPGSETGDFTIYDAVVNENATKQRYHWLKEEK